MISIKALAAKPLAKIVAKKTKKWSSNPLQAQERVFKQLISDAAGTAFRKDHDFISVNNHEDFIKRVPIRDYEALKLYIDRVVAGEEDILWKGTLLKHINIQRLLSTQNIVLQALKKHNAFFGVKLAVGR